MRWLEEISREHEEGEENRVFHQFNSWPIYANLPLLFACLFFSHFVMGGSHLLKHGLYMMRQTRGAKLRIQSSQARQLGLLTTLIGLNLTSSWIHLVIGFYWEALPGHNSYA